MKKPQIIVVFAGLLLISILYFLVPKSKKPDPSASSQLAANDELSSKSIVEGAKLNLNADQKIILLSIENQLVRSKTVSDSLKAYRNLIQYWADSAQRIEPYLYYTYSAALLENTEKSLTFAAQLLVNNLTTPDAPPALQKWMALNAKVLLEKALVINPINDTSKINLGACYLFGNISDNPMEGILKVKEVVDKNPQNTYGQLILALGVRNRDSMKKPLNVF